MKDDFYEKSEDGEEELEWLLAALDCLPKERVKVINADRYRLMLDFASELKQLLSHTSENVRLYVDVCEEFSMGSVCADLDCLEIMKTKDFAKIINRADDFAVFARKDGRLHFEATFYSVLESV